MLFRERILSVILKLLSRDPKTQGICEGKTIFIISYYLPFSFSLFHYCTVEFFRLHDVLVSLLS